MSFVGADNLTALEQQYVMTKCSSLYKRHRFPPEIIQHVVWLYHRFNLSVGFLFVAVLGLVASPTVAQDSVDEIVVTSARIPSALESHIGNVDSIDHHVLKKSNFAHIHELLTRVSGVWISRGSGQESLPAIRSPVLTGAGSCGAFLTLEDGIPSRPNGFCNINQLFELPTELSQSVEVIRGPGNALYGSNALHGTINVLLPDPLSDDIGYAGVEIGSNDFLRRGYC